MGEETQATELQVIDFYEYILSYEALAHQQQRGHIAKDNPVFFEVDFRNGALNRYKGTYVAYHKGILAGQSGDGKELFRKFKSMHGSSSLTVFKVPEDTRGLAAAVQEAIRKV